MGVSSLINPNNEVAPLFSGRLAIFAALVLHHHSNVARSNVLCDARERAAVLFIDAFSASQHLLGHVRPFAHNITQNERSVRLYLVHTCLARVLSLILLRNALIIIGVDLHLFLLLLRLNPNQVRHLELSAAQSRTTDLWSTAHPPISSACSTRSRWTSGRRQNCAV